MQENSMLITDLNVKSRTSRHTVSRIMGVLMVFLLIASFSEAQITPMQERSLSFPIHDATTIYVPTPYSNPGSSKPGCPVTAIYDHSYGTTGVPGNLKPKSVGLNDKNKIVQAFNLDIGERVWDNDLGYSNRTGEAYFKDGPINYVGARPGTPPANYLQYDGHVGIDYGVTKQTVYPAAEGIVLPIGSTRTDDNGLYVKIKHEGLNLCTSYLHLDSIQVKEGDKVYTNTPIGISGNTGPLNSDGTSRYGYHLHFQVTLLDLNGNEKFYVDPYGLNGNEILWKDAPRQVISSGTGTPLSNARVTVTIGNYVQTLMTDIKGYLWLLDFATGTVADIVIEKPGYQKYILRMTNGGQSVKGVSAPADSSASTVLSASATVEAAEVPPNVFPLSPDSVAPTSARFQMNDRVQVANTGIGLRARYPMYDSSALAVMADGEQGKVIGGPISYNGYQWWLIEYDRLSPIIAWSAEGEPATPGVYYLTKISAPTQPILSVSPATQYVGSTAGMTSFNVSNSGIGEMDWAASSDADWLHITSGASGTDSGAIQCSYDAYTGAGQRTGTIKVTAPGASGSPATITVQQEETSPPATTPPGDGLTTVTAYQISELSHLVWMQENTDKSFGKYYRLMSDIDASNTANWNNTGTDASVLEGFQPIGTWSDPDTTSFRGFFDGNEHKITGLTIHRSGTDYVGLFGCVGTSGVVLNLRLKGGSVAGRSYVGGLAGLNRGSINTCYTTGAVTGLSSVGGLVGCGGLYGYDNNGVIMNSYATGVVTGYSSVGGLVGFNSECGTISTCYATGAVTGLNFVGGLVGRNNLYCSITNGYATGAVMGIGYVGGLVGSNGHSSITNGYATGAVTGLSYVGGLVGSNGYGMITNGYAIGAVTGLSYVGGLVGDHYEGIITNGYWDIQSTGQTTSAGGSAKTTAEMQQQATFSGWDFSTVWDIVEGQSYSFLRFSPPPFHLGVTVKGPGAVALWPTSGSYAAGTRVTLTATPADADTVFLEWTGAVENSLSASTAITIDIHRSVTAHFRRNYEIRTLAELQAIAKGDLDGYYTLTNDIDASDTANWNDSGTDTSVQEGFLPIGTGSSMFTGVFEGGGHKITGLTVNRRSTSYMGLFGCVGIGGWVRNLGLENGAVAGNSYAGGLVGSNSGTITNGYATGMVTGFDSVGGLVGKNDGTITNGYAAGTVADNAEGSFVGGLVGSNSNSGTITNGYATGMVTGFDSVGGLVGKNDGTITNGYAAGTVADNAAVSYVGGLVGSNSGTITNGYWDIQSTGQTTSAGGSAKTTAEMQQQATFSGWDFSTVWDIVEGQSYPFLRFSPPPFHLGVTVKGPGAVALWPTSGSYAAGTRVTLTPTPADPNTVFAGWTGTVENSLSASTAITMDSHKNVMAHFRRCYEIRTLAELQAIAKGDLDGYYTLTNDIDASDTANWNDSGTDTSVQEGFLPIGTSSSMFTGVFEGGGHKITGLTVNRRSTSYMGLFGCTRLNAVVQNVCLEGGMVTGPNSVGGLVGYNINSMVMNCYTTGAVVGNYDVGGLVGHNMGTITNSYVSGPVSGASQVGGLVGTNSGTIMNGYAIGPVNGWSGVQGIGGIGGLVGGNDGTITNCYTTGAVTGNSAYHTYSVGGLVGINAYYGTITNGYAAGTVTSSGDEVGGLVGYNFYGTITNCYATGTVMGYNNVGGLVGYKYQGAITNCYWDTQSTSQTSSYGGTGKTTAEMQQQETFQPGGGFGPNDWDFATIWDITADINTGYPYLLSCGVLAPQHMLIYAAGNGGLIIGTTPQTVSQGTSGSAVTAAPGPGYHFVRWSDGVQANPRTDTNVTADLSVTALFATDTASQYTLTYTAGACGSITGTTPQTVSQGDNGSVVTAVPVGGYHFVNWSDGSTFNPRCDTNIQANLSVTANFATNPWCAVIFLTDGTPGAILTGSTMQMVDYGANSQPVTAVDPTGYHFVGWTQDGVPYSSNNTCLVSNVTQDVTLTANFEAFPMYTIELTADPVNAGALTKTPDQDGYLEGTKVTLNAVAAEGFSFRGWVDNATTMSQNASYPYTVTGTDKTFTAKFKALSMAQYMVSAVAEPTNSGTVSKVPDQVTYSVGDEVTLSAVAVDGWAFVAWMDGATTLSTSASYEYTVTAANKTLIAKFSALPRSIYRVKFDVAAGGDGSSWAKAFRTLQGAVDAASSASRGDVWVAAGTYFGTGDQVVNIPANVQVYGGFSGTETVLSDRDPVAHQTVIDGQQNRRVVENAGLLDGFIVLNGNSASCGGIFNSGTVANCTVAGNFAEFSAGGIYNSGIVTNCKVIDNTVNDGDGGGISNDWGTVINCTVTGNFADYGDGISNYGTVTNCIVWRNGDSDILGTPALVTYSCFSEASGANHNLRANPRFVSTEGDNSLQWDLRLQADSPCIDAGDVTPQNLPATDLAGNPRPGGNGLVDMGAYESLDAWTPGGPVPPIVLYVSPQGNGSTGQDWTSAFQTITSATQAVQTGDDLYEIRVATGTYREGHEIILPGRASLIGGWSGNVSNSGERDVTAYKTVIDGEHAYRCITNYSLLDGLWIQNGLGTYGSGGGIFNFGTVTNCTVTGNSVSVNESGSLSGGGIYNGWGTVTNSTVMKNSANGEYSSGGGIENYSGTVINCTVTGNSANGEHSSGGGISTDFGTVSNCTVTSNSANKNGGGIYNYGTVINSTVTGNSSNQDGGGIFNGTGSVTSCTVTNCIVWRNGDSDVLSPPDLVTYSCFGESTNVNHNLNTDPRFISIIGPDPLAWDLRLQADSPCIDTGTSEAQNLPATDLLGNPRPLGKGVDIGAYEFKDSLFMLNVVADPANGGTVSKAPDQADYVAGAQVTLTAIAADGYTFRGWLDGSTTVTSPYTMPAENKTLTAKFKVLPPDHYTVTMVVDPAASGTVSKTPDQATYTNGAQVTLNAVEADGYTFDGWFDGATKVSPDASYVYTVAGANKTFTAKFTQVAAYTLAVTADPANKGAVAKAPDQASYTEGAVVTLTATPATDCQFDGWYDGATLLSTASPYAYTMPAANKALTAKFGVKPPNEFTVTVVADPANGGTVSKTPDQATYTNGAQVTLNAVADAAYTFAGWYDGATQVSPNASYAYTVAGANKTFTAKFTAKTQYNLTVMADPSTGGTVSKTPDQATYLEGAVVTLAATPMATYEFVGWYDGDTQLSTAASYAYTMPAANKSLTAKFQLAGLPAPANLTASGNTFRVLLNWSPVTDAASYLVERTAVGTTLTLSWAVSAAAALGGSGTDAFADDTASPAVPYSYTVKAVDAQGKAGLASVPATATVTAEVFAAANYKVTCKGYTLVRDVSNNLTFTGAVSGTIKITLLKKMPSNAVDNPTKGIYYLTNSGQVPTLTITGDVKTLAFDVPVYSLEASGLVKSVSAKSVKFLKAREFVSVLITATKLSDLGLYARTFIETAGSSSVPMTIKVTGAVVEEVGSSGATAQPVKLLNVASKVYKDASGVSRRSLGAVGSLPKVVAEITGVPAPESEASPSSIRGSVLKSVTVSGGPIVADEMVGLIDKVAVSGGNIRCGVIQSGKDLVLLQATAKNFNGVLVGGAVGTAGKLGKMTVQAKNNIKKIYGQTGVSGYFYAGFNESFQQGGIGTLQTKTGVVEGAAFLNPALVTKLQVLPKTVRHPIVINPEV